MTNPYQPPESSIEVHERPAKGRWKAFFALLLILEILTLLLMFVDPAESALESVLELVIYALVLLGVFGYAFDRRFFAQAFWRGFLPLVVVYDVYFIFIKEDWRFEDSGEMYLSIAIFAAIFVPLVAFQYLALYRYGFRAREIWGAPD